MTAEFVSFAHESALESGEDVYETLRREFARSRVSRGRDASRLPTLERLQNPLLMDSQTNGRPAGSLRESNPLESTRALPPQRLSPLAEITIDLSDDPLPLLS